MRTPMLLVSAVVLSGCSIGKMPERLDQQQASIEQLEQSVNEVKQAQQRADQALTDMRQDQRRKSDDLRKTVRQQIADDTRALSHMRETADEHGGRIARLEAAVEQLKAQVLELQERKGHAALAPPFSPAPPGSDFVEPPAGSDPDLFPIRVSEVAGQKVVAGKHVTTRYVPGSKPVGDEFGSRDYEAKETEVDEYAYQVACTLQNLTRTPKEVALSAGESTEKLTLEPGQTRTNVSVIASRGADLSVMVGGYARRYPVAY